MEVSFAGIKDYHHLVNDVAKILRPRGMCLFQESDLKPYTFDKQIILEDDSAYSAVPKFLNIVSTAIRGRGGQLEASSRMLDWVREHHLFEDAHSEDVWMSIGPWYDSPSPFLSSHVFHTFMLNSIFTETEDEKISNEVGRLFRENVQVSLWSPVLCLAARIARI